MNSGLHPRSDNDGQRILITIHLFNLPIRPLSERKMHISIIPFPNKKEKAPFKKGRTGAFVSDAPLVDTADDGSGICEELQT
jgi:hypothetical protein